MIHSIKGYYHDSLINRGHVQWNSGWRPNLIVHECNVLLAALMGRQPDLQGILYWAIGEGEEDWDDLYPSPQLTSSRLAAEITRQALAPEQIIYLDGAGEPSEAPTGHLEIAAEFKGDDLAPNGWQSLREFALFGGDATAAPDSGFMVDYVIHPRIDLSPGATLKRKLHLIFEHGAVRQEEALVGFGANLPVNSVDGVDAIYAGALQEHGIYSLGSLAEIDSLSAVEGIPPIKLREFRAKARLVMRLRVDPVLIEPFAEYNVSHFLQEAPKSLVRPGVSSDSVMYLQEALANLQIALDDVQLQGITLADLMGE
jgi:hypothetical protein